MRQEILSVSRLTAWYQPGRPVLSDLSAALYDHETVGLIGLNGAGKTTLINILSGLHTGYRAEGICCEGHPADLRGNAFKERRYTVFAEDHSFRYFTFREYLSYVSAAYHREMKNVEALIEGFHFENHTDVLLRELSTGNQKKAWLITAFALAPELLFLDEPVNGLDFQSTEYLYRLMAGYREHGTLLFSSHILESITLTADRVMVLEDGRIRQTFCQEEIDGDAIRHALHEKEKDGMRGNDKEMTRVEMA